VRLGEWDVEAKRGLRARGARTLPGTTPLVAAMRNDSFFACLAELCERVDLTAVREAKQEGRPVTPVGLSLHHPSHDRRSSAWKIGTIYWTMALHKSCIVYHARQTYVA
jgi:hypothetical protein